MEKIDKLSIIVPAYNEARTIHMILDRVLAVELVNGIKKELILVKACSKDNTEEILLKYIQNHTGENIQYFKHAVYMGKGAAIHTGIETATGDYLFIQYAYLEYDPE